MTNVSPKVFIHAFWPLGLAFAVMAIIPPFVNEKVQIRREYKRVYQTVLCFADRNGNGYVTFEEQADAWRRMGYVVPEGEEFPKPSMDDLQRALESYRKELDEGRIHE